MYIFFYAVHYYQKIKLISKIYSFCNWTFDQFVEFCIFCGCDYLPNIPKIGAKKAHDLFNRHKRWKNVLSRVQFHGKYKIPKNYANKFQQVKSCILYIHSLFFFMYI